MPDEELNKGYSGDSALDDSWAAEATGRHSSSGSHVDDSRRLAAQERARLGEDRAASPLRSSQNGNRPSAQHAEQEASAKEPADELRNRGSETFVNKVAGKAASAAGPGAKLIGSKLKKFGPVGTIILVIGMCMGLFSASQILAPFSLIANGLDQFNVLRTSMNRQYKVYQPRLISGNGRNSRYLRTSVFSGETEFHIKNKLSAKLAKNNVNYVELPDVKVLVYKDPATGQTLGVAADSSNIGKIPSSIEINGQMVDIDTKTDISSAIDMNSDFATSMDRSTRTIKGHIAGWFDDLSESLHLKRIKNSRNRFKNIDGEADDTEVVQAAKTGGLKEDIEGSRSEGEIKVEDDDPPNSGSGNTQQTDTSDVSAEDGSIPKNADQSTIESGITKRVNAAVASLGAAAGKYCGVIKAVSAVNMIVSAMHMANVINYVTGFLEAIQKVQAGDSDGAELKHYMDGMSTKGVTTDSRGQPVEGKTNTSGFESVAWNQFFSDGAVKVSATDPVAQKFNKDYISTNAVRESIYEFGGSSSASEFFAGVTANLYGAAASRDAYKTCVMARQATSTAAVVVDVATVVAAFFTGGGSLVIKQIVSGLGNLIQKTLLSTVVGVIMSSMMSAVIPFIGQWIAKDLIGQMAGEDAAYALSSGFNMYTGKQMQQSSGLVGNEEQVLAQYRETQAVIAEEADYERKTHSPFDITNKYTFLGSIVNSVTPVAMTISSSPLGAISNTVSLVGSAVKNLLPTASAAGEAEFKLSLNRECPSLSELSEDLGTTLVADAYCNPYFVSDYSTINMDPADVFDKVYELDNNNFDLDSAKESNNYNPQIKANSELAKWTIACTQRESQFGTADSTVMNAVASLINTGNATADNIINSGLNAIPYVNNLVDLADSIKESGNMKWVTGEACFSEEAKYYSRYSENQRFMESAGIIEESAVATFLDNYYTANPIDNSWEGVIARYSGLSKETVADAMTVVEYIAYLSEYDPTGAAPLVWEEAETYAYETKNIVPSFAPEAIVAKRFIYQASGTYYTTA